MIVSEGQYLIPIVKHQIQEKEWTVSKSEPFEAWVHMHDGLTMPIAEFLCNCEFFTISGEDECNRIYRSSAVVSIENL